MFEFMNFEQFFLLFLIFCCHFTLQFPLLQSQDCLLFGSFFISVLIKLSYFIHSNLDLWLQKLHTFPSAQYKVTSNFIFRKRFFCFLIINLQTLLPIFLRNFWQISFMKDWFEFTIFPFLIFLAQSLKLLS